MTTATHAETIRIGGGQQAAFMAGHLWRHQWQWRSCLHQFRGQLGTLTSSRKYKQDIHDMGDVTSALRRL